MVTNSNRQPIANTRRTHSESIAQFHLTRIAGNCWKGTAKEHTGEMGLADAGETRGRMHGKWLRGLCALLLRWHSDSLVGKRTYCVRLAGKHSIKGLQWHSTIGLQSHSARRGIRRWPACCILSLMSLPAMARRNVAQCAPERKTTHLHPIIAQLYLL